MGEDTEKTMLKNILKSTHQTLHGVNEDEVKSKVQLIEWLHFECNN